MKKAIVKPKSKKGEKIAKEMAKAKVPEPKPKEEKTGAKISPEKEKFLTIKDACQEVNFKAGIYGAYNPNDKFCQDCEKDYPESAQACKHNTELMKKTVAIKKVEIKKASKVSKPPKEKKPKKEVQLDVFGRKVDSGAGKIDALLLSKEGATMAQMEKFRKAVGSHLAALRNDGYEVTEKDGKYFAKVPKK
jgi:hypothetical protein